MTLSVVLMCWFTMVAAASAFRVGDQGSDVAEIQGQLASLGYDVAADGDFGPATAEAVKAFQAIDGEGYARVDFFVDKNTDSIYLNEINTLPGFTKISMFPMLWQASGLSYPDTIERIIELGYERYYDQNNRQAML